MFDSSKNAGGLKWATGIIVMLFVQLLGVAFASGIVWQKLVSVSKQLDELKISVREHVQNQYTKTEAAGDFGRFDARLGGVEHRIGLIEKANLEASN